MLERKIYNKIKEFYKLNKNKALMITGARQIGKSFIIKKYGEDNYKSFIMIDFINNKDYINLFSSCKSADEIILRLSALFGDKLIQNETLIFFDEVQECPELLTYIKYLVQNYNYNFILSGSLLGSIFKDIVSVPVGYLEIIKMFPLDFEEFAIANGVGKKVIETLNESFINKTPVDSYIHSRMLSLFELYLIIGGMPEVVSNYLETKNLFSVQNIQKSIIALYKEDISKYDKNNKLYLNEIYDLIPSELNSSNKRFILKNLNENNRFTKFIPSFLWLKNAGVTLTANVVDEPKSPLIISESKSLFKLFNSDVGLLTSQYGNDIQIQILNHNTNMNFGSLYENVVAQELSAHGYVLYYYNSKKFGELDFVIQDGNRVIPIEIKSGKDYYRHQAIENVINIYKEDINEAYVFSNSNINIKDKITYYPIYMIMFVKKKELSNELIYDTNFSDLEEHI